MKVKSESKKWKWKTKYWCQWSEKSWSKQKPKASMLDIVKVKSENEIDIFVLMKWKK